MDKIHKLRREIEFLEMGKQRVRIKLNRLHQDLIQTTSTSIAGIQPRQLDTLLFTRLVPIFPKLILGQVTPAVYLTLGLGCHLTETK